LAWYEIALLLFIGVVVVWFSFGGHGGLAVTKALFAPLELLVVPMRAIHRISKDDTRSPAVRLLAQLVVKAGWILLVTLAAVATVLYIFRRAVPRLWH